MGKRILEVVPYVVFLVALFFVEYNLFGVEDALLGIVFQSFAKTMVETIGLSFANYLKHAFLFFLMSLCASVAGLHPVLLVCGSALYMFGITLLNSDPYLPRNFFMLGMGFLLLEIYPIGIQEIPIRLGATVFAIACTTAFIYTMKAVKKESEIARDRRFIMRAFDDIGFQLIDLSHGNTIDIDSHRVYAIAQEYCNTEYGVTFRQGGLLSGRQRYTFSLLVCAEQIADMIQAASRKVSTMGEKEQMYFLDLSEVFLAFGKGRILQVRAMIDALEGFLETHKLDNIEHDTACRATLEALVRTLRESATSRDNSTPLWKGLKYRARFISDNFSHKNPQIRFAIQLSVIVGVGFLIAEIMSAHFDTRFGVWIPLTSFLMLNTYRDETIKMMGSQTLGMFIGIAVFVGVIHFIPLEVRLFFVLVIGYTVILLNFGPAVSMAAGTQLALTALYSTMSLGDTLFIRLLFVLCGTLIVLTIVFVLLQARRNLTISHKVQEMERVDERLLSQIRRDIERGRAVNDRTLQLLYYLHMNAFMLKNLAKRTDKIIAGELHHLSEANFHFAMDAGHAVVFLNSDIKNERFDHLDGTTEKLRIKIDDMPVEEVQTHAEEQQ